MTFWEALGLVSAMVTILGVFLTIYAIINNKTLKEESKNTREMIKESSEGARELLARMERGQEDARKEVAAAMTAIGQAVTDSRKEMADAIGRVAELIRVEGQATREAMRTRT